MLKYVSKDFRSFIINRFPKIIDRPDYFKLLCYIMFSTSKHIGSDYLLLHHELLLKFGETYEHAIDFLNDFKKDVLPDFTWKEHNYKSKLAREVLNPGVPIDVLDAVSAERARKLANKKLVGLVHIITGKVYNKTNRLIEIKSDDELHSNDNKELFPVQKVIMDVIQDIDSANLLYKRIINNWDAGLIEIAKIDGELYKTIYHNCMLKMAENPKVYYKTVENSIRIYADGMSLCTLPSDVRKVLLKGCYEADLKQSQLAIYSALNDNQFIKDFIASGKSAWTELNNGIKPDKKTKKAYKKAVYGIVFGMGRKRFADTIAEKNIQHIAKHPLIKELFKCRSKFLKRLIKMKTYLCSITNRDFEINKDNVIKIAPYICQSIEMFLISGIFENYKKLEELGVRICLFQHDGYAFTYTDTAKIDTAISFMNKLVQDKVEKINNMFSINLETGLEISKLD